ncbi:TPA: hypothetical protein ACGOZD_002103 [Streptococcus suis]
MHYLKRISYKKIRKIIERGLNFQSIKKYSEKIVLIDILLKIVLVLATVVIGAFLLSEHLIDYATVSKDVTVFRHVLQAFSAVSILIIAAYLSVNIGRSFF